MELMIGLPILVVIYAVLIVWMLAMLYSTTCVKRRKNLSTYTIKTIKNLGKMILVIYLMAGFIMLSLVAVNVFHKLNKFNLTKVDAYVMGGDWELTRSNRGGSYTNYELFLLYLDDERKRYITQKAVTGATYHEYERGDKITLFYRNNNAYDIFVQAKSMSEIWPAFLNFLTLILGLYVVSVFYLVRNWRKKRLDKQEPWEVTAVHN